MSSCQCDRIESKFDETYASEKLALYRTDGPDPSTEALISAITQGGVESKTLLDIGGGVGAVQHALLAAGVSSVVEVEASEAYAEACRAEAELRGLGDSISHVLGDFGSVSSAIEPADIVTLDRSVCCWHDMPDLVSRSASKAKWRYGMVYPRDVWWVRYGWRLFSNTRQLVNRSPLRVFAHRTRDIERILAENGLLRHSFSEVGVWQIATYQRSDS